MLLDLKPVRSGREVSPRSFSGLMDLYEQNYMRLRKIAPDLEIADHMISSIPGHTDLYLSIQERCKYTTMLSLTYRFGETGNHVFEPNLKLKVYHDARVVEVQQFHSRNRGSVNMSNLLYEKWTMNRFLYKWLGYCLYQGHFFLPLRHLK
jgi:uncharacterized protein YqiB (DUF1249 family)